MAIIKQYHKDTDTTYIFESKSYWIPELKQSRSKRKLLGKLDPVTGDIVPCGKRGPKKKSENNNQVDAEKYTKLLEQYEKAQGETAQLRLDMTEMEKRISDLRKQNQRMSSTIQKIRGLIAE